jgi:hypothetical protein
MSRLLNKISENAAATQNKVNKRENFFGSDFEFFTFLWLVMPVITILWKICDNVDPQARL